MGRKKVQHELISNEITRKNNFQEKKLGLLKKLKEITTLCGVIGCGIIFHNFHGNGKEDQLEVWPYVPEANDVLKKFKDLPKKKKEANMLNHETLLEKNLRKIAEKLNDEIAKNKWMEMELLLMEDLPPISEEDLHDEAKEKLNCKREILNEMIQNVTERIENFKSGKKNK
ncbi:Agamous-like MADS-box protein AGL90 [Linum perenne]